MTTPTPSQRATMLTENQVMACLVEAKCLGKVWMSIESGVYSIDRPTANAMKLAEAIERALLARLGEQQPVAWRSKAGNGSFMYGPTWSEDECRAMQIDEPRFPKYEHEKLYAHPPAAQPVAQGEREAFEAWASRNFVQAPPTAIDFTQRPWSLMWLAWQAARSAAQGAAQVPQWTSVHDVMPQCSDDEDVPVWTWDGISVNEDNYGAIFEQPAGPAVGGWVQTGHGFLGNTLGLVTHWMPRPTPAAPSPAGERTSTEGDA